jgi:hypothetical protein
MMAKSAFADPLLLAQAEKAAAARGRNLRRVNDVPYRDMITYQDTETGEKRNVSNKARLALGAAVAFELAPAQRLESNG